MDSVTPVDETQIIPDSKRPTIFGGLYKVARVIHRGSTSIVHEAQHLVTTRSVALKVACDVERRLRVASEAAALGRVDHPNVVRILDARVGGDDPFIALELLHGRTLHGIVCAGRALPPETVATLGSEIAQALSAVHAAGLVHGSLSTNNVFVAREHGREVTKVLDFERAGAPGPVPPGLASNVAPESRAAGQLDARSDLYTLGALLDECMRGATATGTDRLAEIVRQLLQVQPEARPQSAQAVVELLAPITGARPLRVLLPPPPPAKGAELRKEPRASYVSPVRVFVDERSKDGRSEDISGTGMLVVLREAIVQGTVVRLRFGLPMEGTMVECKASVAWARSHQSGAFAVGLSFIETPLPLRTSITRYVEVSSAVEAGRAPS